MLGIPALESQAACRSGCDLPSGIPLTYAIAVAAVNENSFGKNFREEEIQRLTNYVLPKMVIGAVVSVSIVSVIIAAYIGPMIF